jgi:small GTP-binding protein
MSILGKSNLNVYHNPEIEIKITVVGESGVGKSTLSQRIAYDKFKVDIESTIGAAFCTFRCSYENTNYVFKLWDTAGQERFDALVPMYLNGSHIVLMVFDITNYSSFEKIKDKWYKRVIDRVPNAHILLIGNKADLKSDPQADLKNQNADNNDDFNVINDFIGNI